MGQEIFELKKGHSFIALNNLLQLLGIAETGGHAKIIIQNKEVLVNGDIETRVRKKLYSNDLVKIGKQQVKIS